MRYKKAELHSLSNKRMGEGTCGNGTAAAFSKLCTVGSGDNGSGYCLAGTGAGWWCDVGTGAAGPSRSYCSVGNSPNTTCVVGGTPSSN